MSYRQSEPLMLLDPSSISLRSNEVRFAFRKNGVDGVIDCVNVYPANNAGPCVRGHNAHSSSIGTQELHDGDGGNSSVAVDGGEAYWTLQEGAMPFSGDSAMPSNISLAQDILAGIGGIVEADTASMAMIMASDFEIEGFAGVIRPAVDDFGLQIYAAPAA